MVTTEHAQQGKESFDGRRFSCSGRKRKRKDSRKRHEKEPARLKPLLAMYWRVTDAQFVYSVLEDFTVMNQ